MRREPLNRKDSRIASRASISIISREEFAIFCRHLDKLQASLALNRCSIPQSPGAIHIDNHFGGANCTDRMSSVNCD